MTEQTKKIVLPAYLLRRFEAFRIVKGDAHSYLLRDKLQGKTYDFDAWQFFILETLPGCERFERLQTAFQDRFDRTLTQQDLDEFFGSMVQRKLFDDSAVQHPLLAPYLRPAHAVEEGKAPKLTAAGGGAVAATPVAAPSAAAAKGNAAEAPSPDQDAVLPAGVQDALGLDWRTTTRMFGLLDPRPMFRLLTPVLLPLRHLVYTVPLFLLAALLIGYQYSHLVSEDFAVLRLDFNLFKHLLFMFVTVHVVTTLTAGAVAHAYKVSVDQIGITFAFGFIPRWTLKMTGADRLTRLQTMWLHGAILLARVLLFSLAVLVWFNTRDADGELSKFALVLAVGCAAGLLLESGNPLIKSNGYYLLAAYLNEPHLRGKAYAALLNKLRGGIYRAADNNLLLLYGMMSATYTLLLILFVAWVFAKFVIGDLNLGGSAIILTLAFVGYAVWRNYAGLKKFGETLERQVQFDRWRSRTLPVDAVQGEVGTPKANYWKRALVVCLVLALFLPYPYEPGGSFLIHPAQRQIVSTDEPGLIEAVFFEGGETVKQGTVLARLAHEDYLSQIKVLSAKIEEQRAVVENLKTLPRPQEIRLAEQLLAVERTRESFSREKVPRLEKLYQAGAISFEEFDAARKEHLTDVQQVAQKEAELSLVKAPVTASQVAAAQAKLASLEQERAGFEAKIKRTVLRMPFDGNILTLHLKDKVNSYLDKGAPFAVLEYTGVVTAEIDVPESDVQYVKIGTTVRARPVSFFDDNDFEGKVTLIDRNVTAKSTGNVVKVIATIDNRAGLLRTGMTGRAKVVGESMPVWRAFSLAIVRFVQVQVWSWIP